MKFLLTNDDGIDAPGLAALEVVAASLGEYAVLAPQVGHSGCGHQVTTNRPLVATACGHNRRCIDGTPVDCTRLALTHFHRNVDWVLSGINAGGNLGVDAYISGTVAAVREAVLLGKPGIALSHYHRRGLEYEWERVVPWVTKLIRDLLNQPWSPGTYYNVNVPNLEPGADDPVTVHCFTDTNPLPVNYREEDGAFHYSGLYHLRPRAPGSDVDVCFSGKIAVATVKLF